MNRSVLDDEAVEERGSGREGGRGVAEALGEVVMIWDCELE